MAIIHLLDDDPAVTRACAFLLESLGYEAVCWEEGERFLAQADLYQVGVVLLDMRMPVLDGQAVHEALRQRGSTLAVVFLTGHGDVPMAVEEMKRGAVDFLQKPVSLKPLQAALEHGLTVSGERFAQKKSSIAISNLPPKRENLRCW
jgi:two-component system response regulator TtrR